MERIDDMVRKRAGKEGEVCEKRSVEVARTPGSGRIGPTEI